MREEDLRIIGGTVEVTRLYDVAYEIDLQAVADNADVHPTRLRIARARPRSISYSEPPIDLDLGARTVTLDGIPTSVRAVARVFDFGAIRLGYILDLGAGSWSSVSDRVDALERFGDGDPGAADLGRVLAVVGPALSRPSASGVEIDHTFVTIHGFDPVLESEELLERVDLVPILTGDHEALSARARREALSRAHTYYADDLVVIGPTRSFIVEPEGEPDVADVIGMAHAQLLELRYFDQLLAKELIEMHARVERARGGLGALARRRYSSLAQSLYALHAEVTSVSERIENALVVTDDVYLARVYESALEQHRVPSWSAGVHRSLELIRDAYSALNDEATSARAEYLEAAIVLLIMIDIVLVLLF